MALGIVLYLIIDSSGSNDAEKRFKQKADSIEILKIEISGLKADVENRSEIIADLKETDSINAAAYQKEKEVLQGIISKRNNAPPSRRNAGQQDEYFINDFGNTLQDTAVVNMVIDSLEDRKFLVEVEKLQGIQIDTLESMLDDSRVIIEHQDSTIFDQNQIIQKHDSVDVLREGQIGDLKEENKQVKKKLRRQKIITISAVVLKVIIAIAAL